MSARLAKLHERLDEGIALDLSYDGFTSMHGPGICKVSYYAHDPEKDFVDMLAIVDAVYRLKQCPLCLHVAKLGHDSDCPLRPFQEQGEGGKEAEHGTD